MWPVFSIKAIRRLKVSCGLALKQLNRYLDERCLDRSHYASEFENRAARYAKWRDTLRTLETPSEDGIVTVPYLTSRLRELVPQDTTFVLEAVTNAGHLIHHLNLTKVWQTPRGLLAQLTAKSAGHPLWQWCRGSRLGRRRSSRSEAREVGLFRLCNVSIPNPTALLPRRS